MFRFLSGSQNRTQLNAAFKYRNNINVIAKRNMIVLRIIKEALKLRYFIFASTAGGGYFLTKKYEEIRDAFPDLGQYRHYLPEQETMDNFVYKLRSRIDEVSDFNKSVVSQIYGGVEYKYKNFEDWIKEKSQEYNGSAGKVDLNDVETIIEIDNLKNQITEMDKSYNQVQNDDSVQRSKEELVELQAQYEKEKHSLEDEVQELKRQLLLSKHRKCGTKSKIKRSLIEMYSEVLDELELYDTNASIQDQLPRVVVVGEQSAGKTSVLEMVAGARLFPRGAGSMMTRAPVKVTLAEGPYRVARFEGSDEEDKEFDLESESGRSALRQEIEARMDRLVAANTVTKQPISLSVRGPGLHRMVLVDLPGVINTVTSGMADGTKEAAAQLAKQYMGNPNAIILCIQDASRDAESSSIVDLVSSMDPTGRRTIFVLTKLDLAEKQLSDPDRIKQIMSGKVFKMKALGYYAVIAGKGGQDDNIERIKEYEHQFFKQSHLFKDGLMKSQQMTTLNMSKAVSERFWKTVRESVEHQTDRFRALKSNMENEWKHKYSGVRQLDRVELFEKARNEILDNLVSLSIISPYAWEDRLTAALWRKIKSDVLEKIYLPAYEASQSFGEYKTTLENSLDPWATDELTLSTISAGWESMRESLQKISGGGSGGQKKTEANGEKKGDGKLYEDFQREVEKMAFTRHKWDNKANSSLKIIQKESLNDVPIRSKGEWDEAVKFLSTALDDYLVSVKQTKVALKGPGFVESWTRWRGRSPTQKRRVTVFDEVDHILKNEPNHKMMLSADELTALRRNLQLKKVEVTSEFIQETWTIAYREMLLSRAREYAKDCQKGFYHYQYGFADTANFDCKDVQLFHRLRRMLTTSAAALRNQIMNNEVQRMDVIMKDVLEEMGSDPQNLRRMISGDRVTLAEDIKRVRHIQEKLDEFVSSLNKERA